MTYDFEHIQGPKKSAHANFELLIGQLLSEEVKAESINGNGGDNGIDSFLINNLGAMEVFQAKYFTRPLTPSQRSQIKSSLFSAREKNANLAKWILCIPHDHTPTEKKWFDKLSNKQDVIEWWGETKIRNLLAKYPQIGSQFFRDERLIEEFRKFAKEANGTPYVKHSDYTPLNYASSIREISNNAHHLFRFYFSLDNPSIAIDIMDIHSFTNTTSHLRPVDSIFDYCFDNIITPLSVLPPSIMDLKVLTTYLINQTKSLLHSPKSKFKEEYLEEFLDAYRTKPTSEKTQKLYETLCNEYESGFLAFSKVKKLMFLINSNKINFIDEEEVSNEFVIKAVKEFSKQKLIAEIDYTRQMARYYRDAMNLAYLNNKSHLTLDSRRMISSSRHLKNVARVLFEENPVVEFNHFSFLIFMLKSNENNSAKISREIDGIIKSTDAFHSVIATKITNFETSGEFLEVFKNFAPYYKKYFRPVDEMIRSASNSTKKEDIVGMRELYEFLSTQTTLSQAFENWWNHILDLLQNFEKRLPDIPNTLNLIEAYQRDKLI